MTFHQAYIKYAINGKNTIKKTMLCAIQSGNKGYNRDGIHSQLDGSTLQGFSSPSDKSGFPHNSDNKFHSSLIK